MTQKHGVLYGYLKETVLRRADQKEYVFKEAEFPKLYLNEIKYMYLLYAQNKLHHLKGDEQVNLVTALRLFIRRIVLKKRVEDVQLGVKSYQTKLNIIRRQVRCADLDVKEPYTTLHKPRCMMIDYALWEVIDNSATLPKTQVMEGVTTVMHITTFKARSTLMMGIPNEHPLKLNSIKHAKQLLEAVEKRFGGNASTKKTQGNLLKQQYENFIASSSEMLDQTFDRLQKLMTDLDTMSMYDLYNNLKVYEPEVKGMSSSSSSTQNMSFMSSSNNNTSSTNGVVNTDEAVNTVNGVSTASTHVNVAYFTNIDNLSDVVIYIFFASQPNSPQLVHEDLEQIYPDDMEEMYLRWQMAMLTMRDKRFLKKTGRKLTVNRNKIIVLISQMWSAITSTRGDILLGSAELQEIKTTSTRKAPERSDQVEEGPNYALTDFSSSSSDSKISNDSTCLKSCLETIKIIMFQNEQLLKDLKKSELMVLGYKTGLDEFSNKPVAKNCKAKSSKKETKVVRKNDDAPIIEEWVSDNKEENVSQPKIEKKTVRPSIVKKEFVKSNQQEKTARKTIKQVEHHRQNTHSPRGNQRN
nr:hypothetical protein [Tanacetum cinerariifolium]